MRPQLQGTETHGGVPGDRTAPQAGRRTKKSLPVGVGSDTGKKSDATTRSLRPGQTGCTILFMPFSEFHDFMLTSSGELPEKVTSTSATVNDEQGAYFIERVYLFDTRMGMYGKAPSCYRVRTGHPRKEKVDCDLD
jgi:hypothetical protein